MKCGMRKRHDECGESWRVYRATAGKSNCEGGNINRERGVDDSVAQQTHRDRQQHWGVVLSASGPDY